MTPEPPTDSADPDLFDPDDSWDDEDETPACVLALADVLGEIRRPGDFCASGSLAGPLPLVEVTGFGPLPLPFPSVLREALAEHGSPAPYGRGQETLLDPSVRSCLQIEAGRVHLPDRIWGSLLDSLRERVAAGLGVEGPVTTELYKLLLYAEGDFFLPHRDSEKSDGMFGTLVVVLPSRFSGGELVVEHRGEEQVLSLVPDHLEELGWAAFYADCRHELRPVTEGLRLALVFNLLRRDPVAVPARRGAVDEVAAALEACRDDGPIKLVCALDHHYTGAGLRWEELKGPDAARAVALRGAAEERGFVAHLGMVSLTESWAAEQVRWSRWGDDDVGPEDVELIEMVDSVCSVEKLLSADGGPAAVESLPLFPGELCPPDGLEGEPPDAFHFHEATGNEGGSAERIYRRAAVVLWPQERDVAVVGQAGPEAVHRALLLAEDAGDAEREHALLAELTFRVSRGSLLREAWERVLEADRLELVAALLPQSVGSTGIPPEVVRLAGAGLARVDARDAAAAVRSLEAAVARHRSSPVGVARLLASALGAGVSPETLDAGLDVAVALLVEAEGWRVRWSAPALAAWLRVAVTLGREEVGTAVVDAVDFDDVLVPAVVKLVRAGALGRDAAWTVSVRDRVARRAAEELSPPADQSREPPSGCDCEDCEALGAFLRDPARATWVYPVRKDRRKHLHRVVERERLDAVTRTERTGSPHKLVVTKTTGRYEARVAQRATDLETLDVLAPAE